MTTRWSKAHYLAVAALIVLLVVLGRNLREHFSLVQAWWAVMGVFVGFVLILGHGVTGFWRGAFIDERNVISLSRFQMLSWTVLLLSAFMAAAFWNIALEAPQPIDLIRLDPTLWMLMGISTTSLVASPLILAGKKALTPDATETRRTFQLLSDSGDTSVAHQGVVVTNRDMAQASWKDMFTGEETGNAAHLDLSRVQMFFFTIVCLITYAVALGSQFRILGSTGATAGAFPELSEGLLALLTISHAGYLAVKAAPTSQTGKAEPAAQAADAADDQPAVG